MKFSILVPVYNVEQYLEQCVESLLNQTYKGEYEIILVDDGSTDSSGKICDKYGKKFPDKVKVIHKKNEGLVSARQAGIDAAAGEFCFFVDSDDFVELNLLESIFDIIDKYAETDIVVFNMNYFNGTKKIQRKSDFKQNESTFSAESKKEIYEALIVTSSVTSLCLKAVKTNILKNDPTDYSLYYEKNMAEDWFRSIHLLTAAQKIVYINKHLYNYRTNEQSLSRSYRPETIETKNTLYVYDRFMEYLPFWGMNDNEHILKLNARFFNEAMHTFSIYFENVHSTQKRAVINYEWNTMIPINAKKTSDNPYENKNYRKIYEWLNKKDYFSIWCYFFKKRVYKAIKKFKMILTGGV